MDMVLSGILTLVISTIVSWLATSVLIDLAPRMGAVDRPGPRKVHATPTPRIGGAAVFLGFACGLTFAAWATGTLFSFETVFVHWRWLAVAAFVMFLMGFADDLRGLSFKTKFLVQIAAATTVWVGGFRIDILSHPFGAEPLELGVWSLPLTVLWIVGVTNAVNLIDGLDGLAAGIALITTVAVAVIAMFMGHFGVVASSVALVGALVGFLVFNFNPARIFLGDSGSMFLGFVLAVISIRGSQKGTTAVAILAPLLALGLPLFDTSFAIMRRLARIGREARTSGRRLPFLVQNAHRMFLPDRGHVHHQLLDLGLSHRGAVLVLYGFGSLLAVTAMVVVIKNSIVVAALLVGAIVFLSAAVVVIARLKRSRASERAERERDAELGGAPAAGDVLPAGASPAAKAGTARR